MMAECGQYVISNLLYIFFWLNPQDYRKNGPSNLKFGWKINKFDQ
jgi:hypothetical protein